MIQLDYKKFLNWQNLILGFFLLIGLVGFLNFETSLALKTILILVIVGSALFTLKTNNLQYLILAILFLLIYTFYNLYFSLYWPLWLEMIFIISLTGLISFLVLNKSKENTSQSLTYTYITILSLTNLEIFLAFLPWPIDPKSKTIILLSLFYLFYNIVLLHIEKELIWKKIISYIIVVVLIITIIILTTRWYGY